MAADFNPYHVWQGIPPDEFWEAETGTQLVIGIGRLD